MSINSGLICGSACVQYEQSDLFRKAGQEHCLSLQRNRYHGKRQYLFIESICNDPDILAQNIRYKMMYSPDYRTTSEEEVLLLCTPLPEPFPAACCLLV